MRSRIYSLIFAVAGMMFIISTAVIFTLAFKPLYYRDVKQLHLAEVTGYPEEEILENYNELIDYNLYPDHKKLLLPTMPMSAEAEIHFAEVKEIFQKFMLSGIIAGLIFFLSLIIRIPKKEFGYLGFTGVITIGFPLICGLVIARDWERAFILFHKLVFDNDYWLFDPVSDPIIDCLPDAFFFHCALTIIGIILIASIFLIAIAYKFFHERNSQDAKSY